jgi:hypothetical protein
VRAVWPPQTWEDSEQPLGVIGEAGGIIFVYGID